MSVKKTPIKDFYSHKHQVMHSEFTHKLLATLFGILLLYMIVFLGTMIRNNMQKYNFIGKADTQERTITLEAQGKVTATPDIAVTTMGMTAEAPTVAEAQEKNTKVMNSLIEKLKSLGVEEKDLQTANYNIYPQYNYTEDEGRVLTGYQVSQSVTVKIRDLTKANKVLGLAGEVGVNSVSGLSFTIDDSDVYKAEARKLALEKIAEKANALSRSLGVRFVSIVSYNEYENGGAMPYAFYESKDFGMGGSAPTIEAGSADVLMNVNVVFEIE